MRTTTPSPSKSFQRITLQDWAWRYILEQLCLKSSLCCLTIRLIPMQAHRTEFVEKSEVQSTGEDAEVSGRFLGCGCHCWKASLMRRWELLLEKYPAASDYLTKRLGGQNSHRWGAAFLQTFTCKTMVTSSGEGSNKETRTTRLATSGSSTSSRSIKTSRRSMTESAKRGCRQTFRMAWIVSGQLLVLRSCFPGLQPSAETTALVTLSNL